MLKRLGNLINLQQPSRQVLTRQMTQSKVSDFALVTKASDVNLNQDSIISNAVGTGYQPSSSYLMTPAESVSSFKLEDSNKVSQALYDHISKIDHHSCEAGEEDSFFVCDVNEIERQYTRWCYELPRVKPFYAVKCNNDPVLLNTLIKLGAGFDCASKGEIDMMLQMGVHPGSIVYANPCKSPPYIRAAKDHGISLTTFDNSDELLKMAKYHPDSNLLLRIITDDESAQCRLSTKFGATMQQSIELLKLARELQLNVCGVAFHVGSGSSDNDALIKAFNDSKILFEIGASLGFNFNILDIGGGFVSETFNEAAKVVNECLERKFSESEFSDLQVIAEPGRYMSSSAFTLACHVVAKRSYVDHASGKNQHMIYLNDGVYGNLNCIIYDHQEPVGKTLTHGDKFYHQDEADYTEEVSLWGPTCDGLDCISKSAKLKFVPQVGDWIYFENIGAYTSAASTAFNGFKAQTEVKYVH